MNVVVVATTLVRAPKLSARAAAMVAVALGAAAAAKMEQALPVLQMVLTSAHQTELRNWTAR